MRNEGNDCDDSSCLDFGILGETTFEVIPVAALQDSLIYDAHSHPDGSAVLGRGGM